MLHLRKHCTQQLGHQVLLQPVYFACGHLLQNETALVGDVSLGIFLRWPAALNQELVPPFWFPSYRIKILQHFVHGSLIETRCHHGELGVPVGAYEESTRGFVNADCDYSLVNFHAAAHLHMRYFRRGRFIIWRLLCRWWQRGRTWWSLFTSTSCTASTCLLLSS